MLKKLNEKETRTLKMGAIGIVAILLLYVVAEGYQSWNTNVSEFESFDKDLKKIDLKPADLTRRMKIVPVFEMPVAAGNQKDRFRAKLDEQFDTLGIYTDPWQDETTKKNLIAGYESIVLKTSGTCRLSQMLDLLANLKQNPYLVGVEELRIECDPENRQQIEFNITVSTISTK